MMEERNFSVSHTKDDADWQFVQDQIAAFNLSRHPALFADEQTMPDIGVYLHDDDGKIVAGALAEVEWEAVHLFFLWVDESLRGQGIGTALLHRVEAEGRAAGAKWASVSTYSFQAPDFYKRHGYRVIGQMDGLPPGHAWILLRRDFDQ
jgi:GNAT superfamily N-acetyltransferase